MPRQPHQSSPRLAFFATAILGIWAAGCTTQHAGGGGTSGGEATANRVALVAHGTPAEQLSQYNQLMRASGYAAVEQRTVSLVADALAEFEHTSDPGSCYTITAFGPLETDVNLYMIDPLGRLAFLGTRSPTPVELNRDIRPDSHPWLAFCPVRSRRLVVRVQMARGEGVVQIAMHARISAQLQPANLAAFFGEEIRRAAGPMDPVTRARVSAIDQRLVAEGYERLAPPTGVQLEAGQRRDFQVQTTPGTCTAFAAFSANQAGRARMSLVDADARLLATGVGDGAEQLLRFCATKIGANVLQVRLEVFPGALYIAAYSQRQ